MNKSSKWSHILKVAAAIVVIAAVAALGALRSSAAPVAKVAPQTQRPLPREWVWKTNVRNFDGMIRSARPHPGA